MPPVPGFPRSAHASASPQQQPPAEAACLRAPHILNDVMSWLGPPVVWAEGHVVQHRPTGYGTYDVVTSAAPATRPDVAAAAVVATKPTTHHHEQVQHRSTGYGTYETIVCAAKAPPVSLSSASRRQDQPLQWGVRASVGPWVGRLLQHSYVYADATSTLYTSSASSRQQAAVSLAEQLGQYDESSPVILVDPLSPGSLEHM